MHLRLKLVSRLFGFVLFLFCFELIFNIFFRFLLVCLCARVPCKLLPRFFFFMGIFSLPRPHHAAATTARREIPTTEGAREEAPEAPAGYVWYKNTRTWELDTPFFFVFWETRRALYILTQTWLIPVLRAKVFWHAKHWNFSDIFRQAKLFIAAVFCVFPIFPIISTFSLFPFFPFLLSCTPRTKTLDFFNVAFL